MNVIERLIAGLSPSTGLRRAMDRRRLEFIERGYEGASKGRRTKNWRTSGADANAEIGHAGKQLRDRARDLRRNNPYASAAIESIIDNVVGYGIKPKPKGRNKTITRRAADAWAEHAETTAIDHAGRHDVYGLQALAIGGIVESGEVLLRRYWRKSDKNLALPFQVQALEADFLDSTKMQIPDSSGNEIIQGVEFDSHGERVAYWLFDEHPGSQLGARSLISKRVPAADVIHCFRSDRPGQVRGASWLAPIMIRLRNFDEVEDAYIEREKIAACFAVFITGQEPETTQKQIELSTHIEPGMINVSPPGSTVEFASPPGVNGYKDFSGINLHAFAAGMGIPYEEFGDLAGVNFSSGRMGYQKYWRRCDRWQWQMFIPVVCGGLWRWFNDACEIKGVLGEKCSATWVPPRRMMVNPKEEIAAKKEEIRNGLTTWSQAVTELGYDATEQAEAIAADNALLDQHELKLDCDPRFALPAGSAGATDSGASNAQNSDDKAGSKTKSSADNTE